MSNRLARETSPYLQQHAQNPVDWYPWGEEAFAAARLHKRPIHLSVGYFACHWCHVMAHECFEDPDIARLLNEGFINIKVDRQERPDVDDLYQRVIQMMGQSGGWPLTVFLTPEQEPFFAGTYFPPEDRHGRPGFPRLLRGLRLAWETRQSEVRDNCAQFLRGFAVHDDALLAGGGAKDVDAPLQAALAFVRGTDPVHGGLGGAPKFPNASAHDLMLRVYARTRDPHLLEALERTLERMAAGGIHDHLGGGFARYSVDERWEVPHFEKMLYDNGQLVKLYADAYRCTQQPRWRAVFEGCIAYVLRDLRHREGAFFASEDADSEGEEGRFYAWSPAEIVAQLGEEDGAFACRAYGVSAAGNFEHGRSVLQRNLVLDAAEAARLETLRGRLFAVREARVRPGRDENILAGWNGLMIQGLCAAYQASGNSTFLDAARLAAEFLATHLATADGGLVRAWRDGVAKGPGFLDDYSFLANAWFDLYESDLDPRHLERALHLVDQILERFWDDGLFFTPGGDTPLIHRPLAPFDGAWPSGISEGTFALLRAYSLSAIPRYEQCATRIFARMESASQRNFFGFSHLLAAQEMQRSGPQRIFFSGMRDEVGDLLQAVHRLYLPGRVLGLAAHVPQAPGVPAQVRGVAAYICRDMSCLPPVFTVEALRDCLA